VRSFGAADDSSVPIFYGLRRLSTIAAVAANAKDWGSTEVGKALAGELAFFRTWEPTTTEECVDAS
jgi:hypothetical protein